MKSTSSWTASALSTLPYSTSPFERDFPFDNYQEHLRDSGETIRWWKGYERTGARHNRGGESAKGHDFLYLEQRLARESRVLFGQTQEPRSTPTFSLLETGTPTLTYLPQDIELAQGDIIVLTSRPILSRCLLEPAGRTRDALPHFFISNIDKVFDESGTWSSAMYSVHEHGIEWREEAPSTSVLIEYRYYCAFEFQGVLDFLGSPKEGLATHYNEALSPLLVGALRLLSPGEDVLE